MLGNISIPSVNSEEMNTATEYLEWRIECSCHIYVKFPVTTKPIQLTMAKRRKKKNNQETKFSPFGLINSQFGGIWRTIDTFQYSALDAWYRVLLSCFWIRLAREEKRYVCLATRTSNHCKLLHGLVSLALKKKKKRKKPSMNSFPITTFQKQRLILSLKGIIEIFRATRNVAHAW